MIEQASKMCECGCGNITNIIKHGKLKGNPNKFIHGHHNKIKNYNGENHPGWRGGKTNNNYGRILIHYPGHHRANLSGYVLRSILVFEKFWGKEMPPKAVIHHIDENKSNDELRNLLICQDIAYHNLIHRRLRAYRTCGHANWRKCVFCKQYDDPQNLYIPKTSTGGSVSHRQCERNYQQKRRA